MGVCIGIARLSEVVAFIPPASLDYSKHNVVNKEVLEILIHQLGLIGVFRKQAFLRV
jgi:hypothetical protein